MTLLNLLTDYGTLLGVYQDHVTIDYRNLAADEELVIKNEEFSRLQAMGKTIMEMSFAFSAAVNVLGQEDVLVEENYTPNYRIHTLMYMN